MQRRAADNGGAKKTKTFAKLSRKFLLSLIVFNENKMYFLKTGNVICNYDGQNESCEIKIYKIHKNIRNS